MGAYLKFLNLGQEKRREAMGRIGRIVDTSIMTLEEAAVRLAPSRVNTG
jgi:hypothetical protein